MTDDLDELMSDNHIDPDVAVEVFVLAPADARDGTHRDGPQAAGKTPGEAMAGAGSWVGARCKRRVPWADVDAPRGGRSALTG